MNIAVDCRMLDSSGVGSYLRGILPFFLQSGHDFSLLGNSQRLLPYSSEKHVTIIPCDIKPFSIKELFFFPSKIIKILNSSDVFFSPFFNIPPVSIPVYTTIHDIIFPDMPNLTGKFTLFIRMWFFRRAYKKSVKIFTVSEFSKSRIEHHLFSKENKGKEKPVIVTYSAVQNIFFEYRKNNPVVQKKETIVFIGNIKKHKGLNCLLDAFSLAKKEGLPHKLVIVGEKEKFRSKDKSVNKKIGLLGTDDIYFTGYIQDKQLMEHLSQASFLVQPSYYEGFGLPPLEAMVLGTHALISDIPVLKEIYDGFPVSFFRAGDHINLKEKMLELFHNTPPLPNLCDELLYKYTFEKITAKILKELQ